MANNATANSPGGDKTSRFLEAIQKYADEQKEKINNEVEQFKAEEIQKATDESLQDAYVLIHKEMDASRVAISSEIARRTDEGKAVLFKKRADITNEVFAKAKEKLIAFAASEEYTKQLLADVKQAADFFGNNSVVLYVRNEDKKYSHKLTSYFTGDCTVTVAKDITVGGFRAVCTDTRTLIDKTLDTKLESQKEWFHRNSGLKVS